MKSAMDAKADQDIRKLFWPAVAAFGALWGALEITLGSFLHSLRVPFSGAVMASVSAGLLVAQRQVMPKRGAAFATGAVAALCKTLSPGATILGPMFAILMESLMVEIALFAFPRAALSAAIAGALAVTWAASQKVLVQVLLYGSTIIDLYVEAFIKVADWLGLSKEAPYWFVVGLLAVIAVIGAVAGLFGRSAGLKAKQRLFMCDRPRECE